MGSVARKEGVPRPASPRWRCLSGSGSRSSGGERLWGPLGAAGFVLGSVSTLPTEPAPSLASSSAPETARGGFMLRRVAPQPCPRLPWPLQAWLPGADLGNRCFRTHSPQPAGRADIRTRGLLKFLKTRFSLHIYIEKGHRSEGQLSIPSPQALVLGCY